MDTTLSMSSSSLGDEDLQALIRDLSVALNREADVSATLPEEPPVEGKKGLEIALGTIAITFLSKVSPVALFNVLRSYVDRDSSIEIEFEREDGRRLRIRAQNFQRDEVDRTFERAREFFGDS